MVQPLYAGAAGALLLLACSSSTSDDEPSDPPGSPTSYEAACAAQVAPACPKDPPGYLDSCKVIFGAQRKKVKPACVEKFDALMQCMATKATYTCSASGLSTATPMGVCASPGSACDACNGASCALAGLLGP